MIGDASMSSHYRLGVGINRIIDSYYDYVEFYANIKDEMLGRKKLIDFIVDFTKSIEVEITIFCGISSSNYFHGKLL